MSKTIVPFNRQLPIDVFELGHESWDSTENLTAGQGKMSSVSCADTSLLWLLSLPAMESEAKAGSPR